MIPPEASLAVDVRFMERALELATHGCGHTRPNPPVGAVLVRDGVLIGEGFHTRCGEAHAEVEALADARRKTGEASFPDSTLYVTLEPCSKPGRVGACTDAISEAGLSRVLFGAVDPNPTNRGKATAILASRGIACERIAPDTPVAENCAKLVRPFAKHVRTGLPFVTVKLAMSLDGKICDRSGEARWVSSAASRARTGKMRERVDAIMVGAETVRKDNPSLLSHGAPNPDLIRVVVSRSGNLPKDAQIFTDGAPNKTLVFSDAREAIETLGATGCLHVLCEGGLALATSLAQAGLVDEWLTVLAPVVIGSNPIAESTRLASDDAFVLFATANCPLPTAH